MKSICNIKLEKQNYKMYESNAMENSKTQFFKASFTCYLLKQEKLKQFLPASCYFIVYLAIDIREKKIYVLGNPNQNFNLTKT